MLGTLHQLLTCGNGTPGLWGLPTFVSHVWFEVRPVTSATSSTAADASANGACGRCGVACARVVVARARAGETKAPFDSDDVTGFIVAATPRRGLDYFFLASVHAQWPCFWCQIFWSTPPQKTRSSTRFDEAGVANEIDRVATDWRV